MIEILKRLQFKNDVKLWILALLLAGGTFYSVKQGWCTWAEGKMFLLGAFALPGFFGLATTPTVTKLPDSGVYRTPTPPISDDPPPPPAAARIAMRPILMLIGVLMLVWLSACSWFTPDHVSDVKDVTKTTLTVLQEACVLANANFSKPIIKTVCNIVDVADDVIDSKLLSARSAGFTPARSYPVTCEQTDAGVILCNKPFVDSDAGAH